MKHDYGTYEIEIINEEGHIIHHHCYAGFREEAEENAKQSSRHWIGGPYDWRVIRIS